jgi:hypothetical protein
MGLARLLAPTRSMKVAGGDGGDGGGVGSRRMRL